MLHEPSHIGVVSEHILLGLGEHLGGADSGLEVAFLGVVGVDVVEVGHGEAAPHNGLYIYFGLVEQLGDMLVLLHFLVPVFLPTMHTRPVPLDHHEVGVQQQNHILFHFLLVQLHAHRLRALVVEGVRDQGRLDHRDAVLNRLPV